LKDTSNIHVFIPDSQIKPEVPTDSLRWIGNYIVEKFADRPNVKIIHAGDFADMPSLSIYDKGTKQMEGRTYQADIDAVIEGWDILNEPIDKYNTVKRNKKEKVWTPDKYITLGNHEDRITRAINYNPQLEGVLSLDKLELSRYGWNVVPFLQPIWLDGVCYAHYFYNPMTSKPYGGAIETRLKNIGHSFSQGHQQVLLYGLRTVSKGTQHGLVAGSSYLHPEAYLGPQANSHWRGIVVKHQVKDGSYDPMFVSLEYLCQRYENSTLENFLKKKYPKLENDWIF
jgi:hypothetical protein